MKKNKKLIKNFILFILLVVLTFSVVLKEKGLTDIMSVIANAKKEYLVIALIFMCLYIALDAINIGRMLKTLQSKSSFLKNVQYSLIGFFFSGITPAATGGQPMQIYYMHKNNIPVAHSTLTFLINLTCIQIVTISTALISVIMQHEYLNKGLISLFILGIILNGSALTFLLISILSKKLTKGIIRFILKILKVLKIKDLAEKEKQLKKVFAQYHHSAKYMKKNKAVVVKNLVTTYIQYFFFYSISYWVYRSFGFQQYSIIHLLTLQSVLYATVSGIPSPGAVGVSEGGYIAIFHQIFTEEKVYSAMLLSRGINFYIFMLVSMMVVMIATLKNSKTEQSDKKIEKS